jgi:hypothetical protein
MNKCIAWAMTILLLIAPTALAGSAADDLAAAEAEYQVLLKSEKRTSTKSLWTQVIASFEDVVDDHPDSPEAPLALFRQGELYMEMFTYSITLGELLKAEKAFRRVISKYPDHELADEARAKLEELDELRTKNCLVRVTPETNLSELLALEEAETGETPEAEDVPEKESRRERRKREKEETPAEDDTPDPRENETPDDPIETIIAEVTPEPETIALSETEPIEETPTEPETIVEEMPSPEPAAEEPVAVEEPGPEEAVTPTETEESTPEPVIVAEAPASPDVARDAADAPDESYGIGSIDPEPEGTSPAPSEPESVMSPVSALPEAYDTGSTTDIEETPYKTTTPVYTDGLPRPTTTPPVPGEAAPESPAAPVDSLYTHYQEDNGGTRMLTPAAPLASTTAVTGIRYFTDTDHTRIVLDTDSAAAFFDSRLPENSDRGLPPRVYIDVFGAELSLNRAGPIDIDDGFVHAIRWSQYNSETVRVVMDLETPTEYRIFTLSDPNRVVIDILH